MATLIQHIALLRAYKEVCEEAVESADEDIDRVEVFFAQRFKADAGGTLWTHLEEIAALIPDQETLAHETRKIDEEMVELLAVIRVLDAITS